MANWDSLIEAHFSKKKNITEDMLEELITEVLADTGDLEDALATPEENTGVDESEPEK